MLFRNNKALAGFRNIIANNFEGRYMLFYELYESDHRLETGRSETRLSFLINSQLTKLPTCIETGGMFRPMTTKFLTKMDTLDSEILRCNNLIIFW